MNITCNRKERIKLFAYDIVNLPFDNTSEANFGKMNQHGAVTRAHCKFKRSLSTQSANLDVVTYRLILPLLGPFWSQSGVKWRYQRSFQPILDLISFLGLTSVLEIRLFWP